jgi:uncharacterized NAD(P)/FAD-binding protein YdhS
MQAGQGAQTPQGRCVLSHVVIVGGGFSGALLAINLVRHDGPRATLIERRSVPGRGTAYSTAHPRHLLNVRAANMSAYPDDPDHFTRWLAGCSEYDGSHFVPRQIYGDYLEQMLHEAIERSTGRLAVVRGDAVDIEPSGHGQRVLLADGSSIEGDVVALAVGNLPPTTPPGIGEAALADERYIADPWHGSLMEGLPPEGMVAVIGTGLTMVDVALLLDAEGFRGRALALSRHGFTPQPHRHEVVEPSRTERPPTDAVGMLRALRQRAREVPWRVAVDELRPYTQGLWRAMSRTDRARFLRHLRPWWDVHRHRISPLVAEKLERMEDENRLAIEAGRLVSVEPCAEGLTIRYRPRGSAEVRELVAAKLVNATGPQGDLGRAREPLLRALRDRGRLRADPLGIGLDVDQDSRAIDRDGKASDELLVIGPMTRGAFWEIVAVPDIRRQAWSIARRLANSHWVEGEGL